MDHDAKAEPSEKVHRDMLERAYGDISEEAYKGKTVRLGIMSTAKITTKNARAIKMTDTPQVGEFERSHRTLLLATDGQQSYTN